MADLSLHRAALVAEIDAKRNLERLILGANRANDFRPIACWRDRIELHERAIKALDQIIAARS